MAKQSITCSHVCRGEGKIYALIQADSSLADCTYRASSRGKTGYALPAIIRKWTGHEGWILILPIAEVSQTCTVTALRSDGSIADQADFEFDPNVARLSSVANTVRNDSVVRAIRNYDISPGGSRFTIYPIRAIDVQDGKTIVMHVVLQLMGASKEDLSGNLETRFLGADGADYEAERIVVLKDSIGKDFEHEGALVRTVTYSIRMKLSAPTVLVWSTLNGPEPAEGFRLIEHDDIVYLLDKWSDNALHAAYDDDYDAWYREHHMATEAELAIQSQREFEIQPVFSIIVPLYHTPTKYFAAAVDSALRQSYGKLQLVLVNSTPRDKRLSDAAKAYAASDSRVTYIELPENLGIAENTNAGIQVATGDYLCFLDHDDELALDALYHYAVAINDDPSIDMLYSDEDKIEKDRSRGGHELRYFAPYFKSDWNPDLIESVNYTCHFLCVRKSIIDALEPSTREYDGAQDHHMVLQVSERTQNIHHVPRVLYHWRVLAGSTAKSGSEKSYAFEAGIKALQKHVERCGAKAVVKAHPRVPYGSGYDVVYELESEPLVSVIIPNKDNIDLLSRCIDSIFDRTTYSNFEIIVVENNSEEEETFDYYDRIQKEHDQVQVVYYEGGFNYSAVNNFGVSCAQGEYLLLLNNDTEVVTENWMERMLGLCMRESTGIVGVKLVYPDRIVQHGGVLGFMGGPAHLFQFCDADSYGYSFLLQYRQDLSAVTAACLMIKRAVFEEVGGFDEEFVVDYNDVVLCLSVRKAGYLVVYEPAVELIHYESVSRGAHSSDASMVRFARERGRLMSMWPEFSFLPDPYGNPNFRQANNENYQGVWR